VPYIVRQQFRGPDAMDKYLSEPIGNSEAEVGKKENLGLSRDHSSPGQGGLGWVHLSACLTSRPVCVCVHLFVGPDRAAKCRVVLPGQG
jgi:hypothetical protein